MRAPRSIYKKDGGWVTLSVQYTQIPANTGSVTVKSTLKRPSNQDCVVLFSELDYEGVRPINISTTLPRWYTMQEYQQALHANIRQIKQELYNIIKTKRAFRPLVK